MVNNGSKDKTNYKSYFSPTCKKQIANNYHVILEPILGFIIFGLLYFLSKATITYFELLPNMPFIIKFIPLSLGYFLFFALLYYTSLHLKCIATDDEVHKSSTDNILVESMLEFSDDTRITPLEKKLAKQVLLSPSYYFVILVIVTLILYFK